MKQFAALKIARALSLALPLLCPMPSSGKSKEKEIVLTQIGTYATGIYNAGAAEIVAHDPASQRLYVVNGALSRIDVLDIENPSAPTLAFSINVSPYGRQANSVAVHDGIIAAAIEAVVKTDPGRVAFFDSNGVFLRAVNVGALPDMLTFTPDGQRVLVANEGEPNDSYTIDPQGSVSIINLRAGIAKLTQDDVTTAGFAGFSRNSLDPSIRIFGPNATVAQDLEPEYIAVSHDSKTAWVTLQENNALGLLDVRSGVFTKLIGLGFKDHLSANNKLDASDRDSAVNIANWPVLGMYQPDTIVSFRQRGDTFLITANEGDAREYAAFAEEARVSSLLLDPAAFPNRTFLLNNMRLGRLNVSKASGDTDGDGDYDHLYAFGARSFSIRDASGKLIFDSGDQFEQITGALYPSFFNASNTNNTFDDRSDNKGPEPEGVTVGHIRGRTYAFIGLERVGGIMIYDVTEPTAPRFIQYVNNRNFTGVPSAGTAGDLGPEGLIFISEDDSPGKKPLLVVANEVSGTTTIYEITPLKIKGK